MSKILMPKGIALWLKLYTKLNLEQISKFCDINLFTLNSLNLANTSFSNPIEIGHLTEEEIKKGEKDPKYILKNCLEVDKFFKPIKKKYISIRYRGEKKNGAIAYILKNYPEIKTPEIIKLLRTTTRTIEKIKKEMESLSFDYFVNPIAENMCSLEEIQNLIKKSTSK